MNVHVHAHCIICSVPQKYIVLSCVQRGWNVSSHKMVYARHTYQVEYGQRRCVGMCLTVLLSLWQWQGEYALLEWTQTGWVQLGKCQYLSNEGDKLQCIICLRITESQQTFLSYYSSLIHTQNVRNTLITGTVPTYNGRWLTVLSWCTIIGAGEGDCSYPSYCSTANTSNESVNQLSTLDGHCWWREESSLLAEMVWNRLPF